MKSEVERERRHLVLTCAIILGFVSIIWFTQSLQFWKAMPEIIKSANLLGYVKVLCYLGCLAYIPRQHASNKHTMVIIIFTWCLGDAIDALDGIVARSSDTVTPFGGKMDHNVIDRFREPFCWMVLLALYPEYMTFWQVILFRMFVVEDKDFHIPRAPILPLIDVAWYFPFVIVYRYTVFKNRLLKILELYLACVYLTWGLEGAPETSIRMDLYFQCYVLGSSKVCDHLHNVTNTSPSTPQSQIVQR